MISDSICICSDVYNSESVKFGGINQQVACNGEDPFAVAVLRNGEVVGKRQH